MSSKKHLTIDCLVLIFFILQGDIAQALSNEGLPGSYGQSDIEEAKVPDPSKRPTQSYSGSTPLAPKTEGTVTTEDAVNPKKARVTTMGTNPLEEPPLPNAIPVNPAKSQTLLMDETITENIKDQIANNPTVSLNQIIVMTQNGIVTLGGSVETIQQKDMIENFARRMPGVKGVNSRITVRGTTEYIEQIYDQRPISPP